MSILKKLGSCLGFIVFLIVVGILRTLWINFIDTKLDSAPSPSVGVNNKAADTVHFDSVTDSFGSKTELSKESTSGIRTDSKLNYLKIDEDSDNRNTTKQDFLDYLDNPDKFIKTYLIPKDEMTSNLKTLIDNPREGVEIRSKELKAAPGYYTVMIINPEKAELTSVESIFEYLKNPNKPMRTFAIRKDDLTEDDAHRIERANVSPIQINAKAYTKNGEEYVAVFVINKNSK